jgi:hypothetical protein
VLGMLSTLKGVEEAGCVEISIRRHPE